MCRVGRCSPMSGSARSTVNGCFFTPAAHSARPARGDGIEVELEVPLDRFRLPDTQDVPKAVLNSLALLDVAPDPIMFPLFAAPFRAVLGDTDFSIHLAGPTGVGKTQLVALAQQFFGAELDSGHLPGSWASTPNALEMLASTAK